MEASYTSGKNVQCLRTVEKSFVFSKNLNMQLPHNPAIWLLGIYLLKRNKSTRPYKDLQKMFIIASLVIEKNQKQHKYSLTSKWINFKISNNRILFGNKKELTINTDNMNDSQNNERSQTKKNQYTLYDFFYI